MIIINADDWGRTCIETDTAFACFNAGRITSVSGMVFMEDSIRAASIARTAGIDVGLHLNFSEKFTGAFGRNALLDKYHSRISRLLRLNKYALVIYFPYLRKEFRYVFQAQLDEFFRLYGRPPSHFNGHHHMHLCSNILLGRIIPENEKVRRNFSFFPGEKGILNRMYRRLVDSWLAGRYCVTDYFFSLSRIIDLNQLNRVIDLSKSAIVEIMTHPIDSREYNYLMDEEHFETLSSVEKGTYSSLW